MRIPISWTALIVMAFGATGTGDDLRRLQYGRTDLTVDAGVGLWAWPLPMDYDRDGDLDLVVSCPDVPFNGIYLFKDDSGANRPPKLQSPVRIGDGQGNIQPSYVNGDVRILVPGRELTDFRRVAFGEGATIYPDANIHPSKVRANQWRFVDYDGDQVLDLIVGVGDWTDYGWDNAYDSSGRWTRGPLHGYVYLIANRGTNEHPKYDAPRKVEANGQPVDVYGEPSPNFGDFDLDGDLDLICGEFLDRFTYFENVDTRREPRYGAGRRLAHEGRDIAADLQMIVPVAIDWDDDGDLDLVVGEEDGRIALIEHTGRVLAGLPQFLPPVYFQQQADLLKFGALVTPVSVDWDADGDEDLVCGNTAGYLGFIENLDGGCPPQWAPPRRLEADGKVFRIQAGENGSIQGPCEAKWGYTTLSVADWDHDGRLDIVFNSIWGRVQWLRNVGTAREPRLAAAAPVLVDWPESPPPKPAWVWWRPAQGELATQWRTTPVVVDWNRDGLADLVMLDHEGYLAFFERFRDEGQLLLKPGRRVFQLEGKKSFDHSHRPGGRDETALRLNVGAAGDSGRRKLCIADWNNDGRLDLLVNSTNVNVLLNLGEDQGMTTFRDLGAVASTRLAGHDTSPTVVDWNRDGALDLLIGAEDGHFYYLERSNAAVESAGPASILSNQ